MAQVKEATNFQTKQVNKRVEQQTYPQRMQDVLDYLDEKPMSIIGHKMQYKATANLSDDRDLLDLYGKLETLDFDAGNKASSIHHAQVCRGLLYLAVNGIDECHKLIYLNVTALTQPFMLVKFGDAFVVACAYVVRRESSSSFFCKSECLLRFVFIVFVIVLVPN